MQSSLAFLRGRVELAQAMISKGREMKPSLALGERPPGPQDVTDPGSPYTSAHSLRLLRPPSRGDTHRNPSRAPSQPLRPRGGEDLQASGAQGKRPYSRPRMASKPAAVATVSLDSLADSRARLLPTLLVPVAPTPEPARFVATLSSSSVRWNDTPPKACTKLGDWSPKGDGTEQSLIRQLHWDGPNGDRGSLQGGASPDAIAILRMAGGGEQVGRRRHR